MKEKQNLPFIVIRGAVNGDISAINDVLNFYKGYIITLSGGGCIPRNEHEYNHMDYEMSELLKARLVEKILEFRLE